MEQKIIGVVGLMIFKDGKLLIDKPRKRPAFQMVGGHIEEGETPLEAVIRECHEELGPKAIVDESKIVPVMHFVEQAASDPDIKIRMHVFKYEGELSGELTLSDEIETFMWFGTQDNAELLSHTLRNKILPYAMLRKLIY